MSFLSRRRDRSASKTAAPVETNRSVTTELDDIYGRFAAVRHQSEVVNRALSDSAHPSTLDEYKAWASAYFTRRNGQVEIESVSERPFPAGHRFFTADEDLSAPDVYGPGAFTVIVPEGVHVRVGGHCEVLDAHQSKRGTNEQGAAVNKVRLFADFTLADLSAATKITLTSRVRLSAGEDDLATRVVKLSDAIRPLLKDAPTVVEDGHTRTRAIFYAGPGTKEAFDSAESFRRVEAPRRLFTYLRSIEALMDSTTDATFTYARNGAASLDTECLGLLAQARGLRTTVVREMSDAAQLGSAVTKQGFENMEARLNSWIDGVPLELPHPELTPVPANPNFGLR